MRQKKNYFFLSLSFLWHGIFLWLFLWTLPSINFSSKPTLTPIERFSKKKLTFLKKQWKSLLLKTPSTPQNLNPPAQANYFSNQNRFFPRQTRAFSQSLTPQPFASFGITYPKTPLKTSKKAFPKLLPDPKALQALANPPPSSTDSHPTPHHATAQSSSQPRSFQTIEDSSLPLNAEQMLNTKRSRFYDFFARIYEQIAPKWRLEVQNFLAQHPKLHQSTYQIEVIITLDEKGILKKIQFTHPSKNKYLNQTILKTWKSFSSFPNPPKALIDEHNQIPTQWVFVLKNTPSYPIRMYRIPSPYE